jgi:hypothetical protein
MGCWFSRLIKANSVSPFGEDLLYVGLANLGFYPRLSF